MKCQWCDHILSDENDRVIHYASHYEGAIRDMTAIGAIRDMTATEKLESSLYMKTRILGYHQKFRTKLWKLECLACKSSTLEFKAHVEDFVDLLNLGVSMPCSKCGEDLRDWGKPIKERTKPFLTAADIVMLREMKIGIGIKLEAS